MKYFLFVVSLVIFFSCSDKSNKVAKLSKDWSPDGIPLDILADLNKFGEQIDYNFHHASVSMNQDGNAAIKQDLSLLSLTPLSKIPEGCAPLARKVYWGRGEVIIEADVYFGQNCYFQVFIKNEKMLYGNLMTEQGVSFYGNVMNQIKQNNPSPSQ